MPQLYSVQGKLVSKEEWDKANNVFVEKKVVKKVEVQAAAPKEKKAEKKTKKAVSKKSK